MFGKKKQQEELPPHMLGPPVEFTPMGGKSDQEDQANLIQARQSFGIVPAKEVIADAVLRHADRVMLDFTREAVGMRIDIDGVWHPLNPMDRQRGDMMLAVLKKIANLNVQDRRSRQIGKMGVKFEGRKLKVAFASQGTPTGERAVLTIVDDKKKITKLDKLGMRDKLVEQFRQLSEHRGGLFIISAPPGRGGLSTTWSAAVGTTDRYMRDFVAIEDKNNPEPEVENVESVRYNAAAGEGPLSLLPNILLKQPDVLLCPEVPNAETMRELVELTEDDQLSVFVSVRAKEASEALLRCLAMKPDPQQFAESLQLVLNTRLMRRLCDKCKQPFQPPPQLLQRLGIPQGRVGVFYQQWTPPPPEAQPKKKNEEPEICRFCSGLGYRGQIAICELMVIDDRLRQVMLTQPKIELLRQASRQAGNPTLQEEGVLLVATGISSLNELQRALTS